MDEEFIALVSLVLFVVLFVRMGRLRARVEHIERYLQDTTASATSSVVTAATSVHSTDRSVSVEQGASRVPLMMDNEEKRQVVSQHKPDGMERFIAWLKEDWLMKLAGLLVILGMGWFVSYAIARDWIGESGRIALGLVVGAGVLALGRYRLMRVLEQGSILMFTGAVIMVLTLFAAREFYDMFTPTIALVLMFGISALLGLTSIVLKHQPLAIANVLLAGVAPLLTNAPLLSLNDRMLYLLILSVCAVGVAAVTGWRILPLLSLSIVCLYRMGFFGNYRLHNEFDTGLVYAYVFSALFLAVSILAMRVVRTVRIVDLLTALLSGIFLALWIFAGAREEWQSLLFVTWATVFAFGAFVATRFGAGIVYFYAYAGVAATFIGIATALELEGPTFTIAAICEAALVLWLGYRISQNARSIPILALPMAIPILLSFESIDSYSWSGHAFCTGSFGVVDVCSTTLYERIFHEDAFILVLLTFVLYCFGAFFRAERLQVAEAVRGIVRAAAQTAWIAAGLYTAILVWLVSHAISLGDIGTILALLTYTLVAGVLYFARDANEHGWQRYTAIALIVFVVGRLLIVEAWHMELLERVFIFLLVGTLLGVVAWRERSGRSASAETPTHIS